MPVKALIKLTIVNTDTPSEFYNLDEIEKMGFADPHDFNEKVVLFSFRAIVEDQMFPIRIWLRKSDFAEADWYGVARAKALDAINQLSAASGSI